MSFLYCNPSVFVINDCYEILLLSTENGVFSIVVDGQYYYENNSGVLSSEKNYAKIRIPQKLLDKAEKYTVIFAKTINRKAYFSEIAEPLLKEYSFKPLTKTNDINIYHIADVHYRFKIAKKTSEYFNDDLDLYVINGDIGEVETLNNYYDVIKFIGDISKGYIPVVFVRGNHDTRGKLAELFTDFFPSNNKETYYWFTIGNLNGIVLDCGEDKLDDHIEYGGVNVFEYFRKKETEFIKSLKVSDKFTFAISHICPSHTTKNPGDVFDIEKDTYTLWNEELNRLNIKFMITAHMHKTYVLNKTSKTSTIPHEYPVIVGSACFDNDIWGTALTIKDNNLIVKFTNSNKEVKEETIINI